MTRHGGFPPEMDPFALDPGTAERLLTGAVDAGDAPPAYRAVARTLQALRTAPESADWAGESAAVEQIAAAVVVRRPRPTRARRSASRTVRLATAAAIAGVLSVTGGFASAGSLPEPAQDAASTVLGTVGISVPTGGDEPTRGEEPPAPNAGAVVPPATNPKQPSPGAPEPGAGAPPAAPASPAAPGNGQGEVHGTPAHGTPPSTAKGRGNGHVPNSSPPASVGNDKGR